MSQQTSQNSSFCQSSFYEDIEVYIKYNSEEFLVDDVRSFQSLSEKIQENIPGVKAQDLKITYQTPNGKVLTVKNDDTFFAACKKMKPELTLNCTLVCPQVPIVSANQQANQGLQSTESLKIMPPSVSPKIPQIFDSIDQFPTKVNHQLPENFYATDTFNPYSTVIDHSHSQRSPAHAPLMTTPRNQSGSSFGQMNNQPTPQQPSVVNKQSSQVPHQDNQNQMNMFPNTSHPQPPIDKVNQLRFGQGFAPILLPHAHQQPVNMQQYIPDTRGMPSGYNQFVPQHNIQINYPKLILKGQDAAKCLCGQYLRDQPSQSGFCPQHKKNGYQQLWMCANSQEDSCSKYCWQCVTMLLKNSKEVIFPDQIILSQISQLRQMQQHYCKPPSYNPHFEQYIIEEQKQKMRTPKPHDSVDVLDHKKNDVTTGSSNDGSINELNQSKISDAPNDFTTKISERSWQDRLGLEQNIFKQLESQAVLYADQNGFIDHSCKQFNIEGKKSELQEFCNFIIKQKTQISEQALPEKIQWPTLTKITVKEIRQKIREFIVNNEKTPSDFSQLKNEYGGLTSGQLDEFKECYKKFKAIYFEKNDLPDEEQKHVFQLHVEKKSKEEIQKITLIHIELVNEICDSKLDNLKQDTTLLQSIRNYSFQKTDDEVIDLILKDADELNDLLIRVYKNDQKDYVEITKKLRDQNYAINFDQRELQKLINKISLPNLCQSIDLQKEVKSLLDYFYEKDLLLWLMVLPNFSNTGQSVGKNLEKIILKQKHKDPSNALMQALILQKDQTKLNEVIQSKVFVDDREDDQLKELQTQINQYLAQKKEQEQIEKNKASMKDDSQNNDRHSHQDHQEIIENEEFKIIQAICNIKKMQIQIFSNFDLTKPAVYKPDDQEDGLLYLVRDDQQQVFYVMIQYKNDKKIINWDDLQEIKKKYSFLSDCLPEWLETFIQMPSFCMFLNEQEGNFRRMIGLLQKIVKAQRKFLQDSDEVNKNKLFDAAIKLNIESQMIQEWFYHIEEKVDGMTDFCNFMKNKGARLNPIWANAQVDKIQQFFPIRTKEKTLKDFNRVQTYQDPDQRRKNIDSLKSQPEQLTEVIINTLFSFILRKDDMSQLQSELESDFGDKTISLSFLIAYLLQSVDFALRARLNYYLTQNKSVPLIMKSQQRFKENQNFMIYNQELIFSMSDVEGAGIFSFGVGKHATANRCGKSEISNLIVTPKNDYKSFDVHNQNVFSNGQIDVFFENCYHEKNGWAFMDGQGIISELSLMSVLPLTNIVFIHFMQKDQNDEKSVAELANTIKCIKDADPTILICLILRDCTKTKDVKQSEYPAWLLCREKIDKIIELIKLSSDQSLLQKTDQITEIMLYFNENVSKIKIKNESKFTKENFLNGFCKMDIFRVETYKRISEILQLSKDFIQKVQMSQENVFAPESLFCLKILDDIREKNLQLRSLELQNGEDFESAVKREKNLNIEKKFYTDQLLELDFNAMLEQYLNNLIHEDSSQIKIEVSKRLAEFTQKNISDINQQKKIFVKQYDTNVANKINGGIRTQEEVQKANDECLQTIKQFEDDIFKRSLCPEYFWRSVICVIQNSQKCDFKSDDLKKLKFNQAIKQQMFDGDTFELIDGRNLEIKAGIIREIVGDEIDKTKCIVVSVIGPQSSGKSTLMNFCFGTQFLASTGRCTQGIYFTLQKIPDEMKNGSDVEYLIILDTEGLNSPERAAGDRSDKEYDRKIVLFTLLCSDFLIINSRGDMSLQMKELIKICAVRYHELKMNAKPPKILYTFVQNKDLNSEPFEIQIQGLRSDVIKSSDDPSIEKTAVELMALRPDSVKVLGTAYQTQPIQLDLKKGILKQNQINLCAPQFGVDTAQVWQIVQSYLQSGQFVPRQIGKWLQEIEDNWQLIDRNGASITQFADVQSMLNDKTIRQQFFYPRWNDYISDKQTNQNTKARQKCTLLYEEFQKEQDIEDLMRKFIEENDNELNDDFQKQFKDQYDVWLSQPSQRNAAIISGAEIKHMDLIYNKFKSLKQGYRLQIENQFKELKIKTIYENSKSQLYKTARNLWPQIKKMSKIDQDQHIAEEFKKSFSVFEASMSSKKLLDQINETNADYLNKTFKSANKFMPEIRPSDLTKILEVLDSKNLQTNEALPEHLFEYLVNHISQNAFKDESSKSQLETKLQFYFDLQQLACLKDTDQRIFGSSLDPVQEKYLPLKKLLKVNYTYSVINKFEDTLPNGVYQLIHNYLQQQKNEPYTQKKMNAHKQKVTQQCLRKVDDELEIKNKISSLFHELSQAGYYFEKKTKIMLGLIQWKTEKVNLGEAIQLDGIFNDESKKQQWLDDTWGKIKWDQTRCQMITPTVQNLLCKQKVKIKNQLSPNIPIEQHQKMYPELKNAAYTMKNPQLSYEFSQNDGDGKINVKKFFQQRKLDHLLQNYFDCLVKPKTYETSDVFKHTWLSQMANALVDWKQIVQDIELAVEHELKQIFTEKKNQNKDLKKFDLQSVIQRCQITMQQADLIQTTLIQPIKAKLENELKQKLALKVHHTLNGVITQVACIIIWYKFKQNIFTIFSKAIDGVKKQRPILEESFSKIARGESDANTKLYADQIFKEAFDQFDESCQKKFNKNVIAHLQSQDIKNKFDTETVYKQLDEKYIGNPDKHQYQEAIEYLTNPKKVFEAHVDILKRDFIVKQQDQEKIKYQHDVITNLKTLLERLKEIQKIIRKYQDEQDDSINFFEVTKAGKKVDDFLERQEIQKNMTNIVIKILIQILDGSYTIGPQILTITFNNAITEYNLTVKSQNAAKNLSGSPLNYLQKLTVFNEQLPSEFFDLFLEKLEGWQNNSTKGECQDISVMVDELINLLQSKISEIQELSLDSLTSKFKEQDEKINYYRKNAIGCDSVCVFCKRKCERAPHDDGTVKHNCENRGHSLRVFGGCTLEGKTYPSLTTCSEIRPETKIREVLEGGKVEMRLWSEIHEAKNNNWDTSCTKFLDNNSSKLKPDWEEKYDRLIKFWKVHGREYCKKSDYTFIESMSNQVLSKGNLTGKQIVILCLDDSGSMLYKKLEQAVQGGKELEQYLRDSHSNPVEVHIQLWFNDCPGVVRVHQGQLSDKIPSQLWNRLNCSTSDEIANNTKHNYGNCGQFAGAVKILNKEVNELLASNNYESVHWFFFTDGGNCVPYTELEELRLTLKKNRANWTDKNGDPKLHPMIITDQLQVSSLREIKTKIDSHMKEFWNVDDACKLKENVKMEKLAATMIEQFNYTD